ncbi:MAG TPA: hypothetical protein VFM07_05445 [Intrasporangium sp.]|nr:hypothetical protein [Intrasporangium sp.]
MVQFVNALGSYLQDQLDLLGWSRATLVARSRVDGYELDAILDAPMLAEWPQPETLMGLARALSVPLREVVMYAAEGCGLGVLATAPAVHTMSLTSNEDLMLEVRRRLALGAATGGYLTSPSRYAQDRGAQSA